MQTASKSSGTGSAGDVMVERVLDLVGDVGICISGEKRLGSKMKAYQETLPQLKESWS